MNGPTVICVFGISGVGKSTLIRRVLEGDGDWQHYQASDLIKLGFGNESVTSESLRRASGDEVIANQMVLVEGFWRKVRMSGSRNVILDGHLLIDTDRNLVEIPFEIVQQLEPSILVHVEDQPEDIFDRRAADSQRTRPVLPAHVLARHQSLSAQVCRQYGRDLGVPVENLRPYNFTRMRSFLDTFTIFE